MRNNMAPLLIQIQRWLMQPHLWRFVGLASTVAGLLCYALSSSFYRLFGEWNSLKIFVYSVFSVIICLMILLAKVRQHTRSRQFKAHMAFLVLTTTSIYSFFHDKDVKGKPDTYILISCAAFSVTSLSLSRLIQSGFEVDLLSFFSGSLIVQLMRRELLLGFIGVAFSYSLIVLRSYLDVLSESEHLGVQDQHNLVVQVDSDSQQANTDTSRIILQLIACIEELNTKNKKVIDMLQEHVNKYFKANNSNYMDHIPVDDNLVIDALQSDTIDKLHEAVTLMLAAGYEKECCDVYSSCRKKYLEECMYNFHMKLPDFEDVITVREREIGIQIEEWIVTSNATMSLLFPNERRLCERVFLGFSKAKDIASMEICREITIRQLNFAGSFAVRSTNLERLEVLPGVPRVFKALHDLIPEYESLFSDPSSDSIRNRAIDTWKILGRATENIFRDLSEELEDWIRYDEAMAKSPRFKYGVPCDVLRCLSGILEAWNTLGLEKVLQEHPMVAGREGTSSSLSIQLTRIMELLDSHLEVKSKTYPEPALRHIFMTANRKEIKKRAIKNPLASILQNGWIEKLDVRVKENLEDYQRSSWGKALEHLKEGGGNEPEAVELMKENLKLFNIQFAEICEVQTAWLVPDKQLRTEIRRSIKEALRPAYGNFIEKLQNILGSDADKYIRYSMHGIDVRLAKLFRGEAKRSPQKIV